MTNLSQANPFTSDLEQFDEMADFIAVGSGGGAMCAGMVMRDAGKSAIILEKTSLVGGTTAKSGGVLWVPCNRFMASAGIDDSFERALTYLDDVVGDDPTARGTSRAKRARYLREAPRMIDFLCDHGVRLMRPPVWPDYYDERPGGHAQGRTVIAEIFNLDELGPWKDKLRKGCVPIPASVVELMLVPFFRSSWAARGLIARIGWRVVTQMLLGRKYVSAGWALQGRMLKAVLAAGIDIRLDSPVHELIVEDGRVTGVRTEKDGRPWRIGARLGVLVNAGGFSCNAEMRRTYMPKLPVEWTNAAEGDTGEMIREMVRIGADIAQMEEVVGNQTTPVPDFADHYVKPPIQGVTAKPHAILVDQRGQRYQNEGGSYMGYCKAMLARDESVPAVPSWAIMDSQFIAKYMLSGTTPGARKPESWTKTGYLKQAGSIRELAGQIGIDPDALENTVARFNGFVDKGVDEDFHRGLRAYDNWLGDPFAKGSPTLGRLDKGPFYAVAVIPGDVGTYGGVVTDCEGQVLREDGTAIAGLYATGTSTASVMGRTYPGAGCSIGPAFTWGFVAARHALGLADAVGQGPEGHDARPHPAT